MCFSVDKTLLGEETQAGAKSPFQMYNASRFPIQPLSTNGGRL